MSGPFEAFLDDRQPHGMGGRWFGVHTAIVVDIRDPDNQGRVKVKFPWAADTGSASCEVWARLATLMAGPDRGTWFVPDPDDEVLVAFEGGDPRRLYVLGMLWNGKDAPPVSMDGAGDNEKKSIVSRNGVKVTFEDKDGQENLVLETPGGQKMTLQDGPGSVKIVDSNGNSVKMEAAGISIETSGKLSISASQVEVSAGMVSVDSGISKFSGMVRADTVQTNTVIAATYTPGAGNIW